MAVIFAGPNGSGKSSLVERLRRDGFELPAVTINPDNIALQMRQERAGRDLQEIERAAWEEGRRLREQYREEGVSFILETTFSHPSNLVEVRKLRDAGYEVYLVIALTSSPDLNVARVKTRVEAGGHDVPETKIRDRYARFARMMPLAVERASRTWVYDNSNVMHLCYDTDEPELEDEIPDYLSKLLLEPLRERAAERHRHDDILGAGGRIALPDEDIGDYEGRVHVVGSHFCLQEIGPQLHLRHETVLMQASVQPDCAVRILYDSGYAKLV